MKWILLEVSDAKIKEEVDIYPKNAWGNEVPLGAIVEKACESYLESKGYRGSVVKEVLYGGTITLKRTAEEESAHACWYFLWALINNLEGQSGKFDIKKEGDKIVISVKRPEYAEKYTLPINDALKILREHFPKAFEYHNVRNIILEHKADIEQYPSYLVTTESGEIFEATCDTEGKAVIKPVSEIHVKIPRIREYVDMGGALDIMSSTCEDFKRRIEALKYSETVYPSEFIQRLMNILEEKVGPI